MKRSFIILCASVLIVACNKQIDEIRPLVKIDQEGELSSVAGIVEATYGNYSLLRDNNIRDMAYEQAWSNISESRGNNVTLRTFGPVDRTSDAFFYRNSTGSSLGFSSAFYRGSYQLIVSVNTVLEGIEKMQQSGWQSLSAEERNKVIYAKGENIFLRAFAYFNLVRVYGKPYYQNNGNNPAVPLKKTSAVSDIPAPSTVKELYDFVISELKTSAQLMKVPVTKSNSFISTSAAWSLLSRAYLYMGGSVTDPVQAFNEEAVAYADSVINHTGSKYALLLGNAYVNMFANDEFGDLDRAQFANNKEIVFAFDNNTGTSYNGIMYNYDGNYNIGAAFVPSMDLKQQITAQDLRSNFYRINPANGITETTKYLVLFFQGLSRAPHIFFRMGEIYLNRAEAFAKTGNFAMARNDLRTIHTRAGLPASDIDNLNDQDLLSAILKERRLELAFEDHAGYDYFRNGLPMTRLAADNNGTALIIQPDDPKVVFEIPNN
ncbi:RagB/SusD family nutrient uptake outer membrane protein [Pseudobacter ginsenosidimutans]|uniref:SusD-like starch-binding protein associating with outer membrane n=1 Tax=Pseudobacter ginsenosidimutans TaxID=661488 RepID=A0A4Q7N696_9BACT|nr:RagB/SusD family nutrient uptake outer membrane protein [Pseudobacter ginsenosidimutans]QEC45105.1 RagB/SusD family nutrient uptake outer membrane protein [Pseudobacter ginsenosidimutans]RZS76601.1 SusD-like starch-binding protein associating with outer membrane [Pseudobacter ginsenosidimutans]